MTRVHLKESDRNAPNEPNARSVQVPNCQGLEAQLLNTMIEARARFRSVIPGKMPPPQHGVHRHRKITAHGELPRYPGTCRAFFNFPDREPSVSMLFELRDLTKTYGRVTALNGLTVSAPEGAIGLLGPNGAGKTTMIRSLLGLIRVDGGEGNVLGIDVRKRPLDVRQIVGFVPEDECLFPGVVGIEFVAYAGELSGMTRKDALQRADEVLDYVGLGEARYRKVDSYSTGMKQRLKIASAIVHDPKLVILDEPTNGMDPAGRLEILELARDLTRNKGISLLFSSHLMPDVEAVCDHVLVMAKGRLLAEGAMAELTRAVVDVRGAREGRRRRVRRSIDAPRLPRRTGERHVARRLAGRRGAA